MTTLFQLTCPTCGARLHVDGAAKNFDCTHCGNRYMTDRTIADYSPAEREQVRPTMTYTTRTEQWLRIGDCEVVLHSISEALVGTKRVLYIDVSYRNPSVEPLKCRHDDWTLFDANGYTYEAVKDFDDRSIYPGDSRRYLGMTRILAPGKRLRGWLGFLISPDCVIDYLQFAYGWPLKAVEFHTH